ncbi:WD40-repeat-containing domain protein [Lipomyces kononenkoae]|uniref:WD40-repeat-containing domain protein n=1 Tax=Lipomyces kononenkoae TaxID=34357 RepID=A0ACC3T8J0_LIPKO
MFSNKSLKFVRGKSVGYSPEYVYSLDVLTPSRVLSSLSDKSLRIFDTGSGANITETVKLSNADQSSISGVSIVDDNTAVTAGQSGVAKVWDFRQNKAIRELSHSANTPLLSVAYSKLTNTVAAGTELVGQDSGVVIWCRLRDLRNPRKPVREYIDSHNDDVTCVAFHPTTPHSLLSGATDGLVTRYNTAISDEDDAVMQVVNHGASIRCTGFFGNDVYALSHMETFSIYKPTDKDDEAEEDKPENKPTVFGDVREQWGCEYVVDIGKSYAAVGSNSDAKLSLIPMKGQNVFLENRIELPGAHGEEVVRCVLVDDRNSRIFTGGEDGNVSVWLTEDHLGDGTSEWSQVGNDRQKHKKHKDKRFKPY